MRNKAIKNRLDKLEASAPVTVPHGEIEIDVRGMSDREAYHAIKQAGKLASTVIYRADRSIPGIVPVASIRPELLEALL